MCLSSTACKHSLNFSRHIATNASCAGLNPATNCFRVGPRALANQADLASSISRRLNLFHVAFHCQPVAAVFHEVYSTVTRAVAGTVLALNPSCVTVRCPDEVAEVPNSGATVPVRQGTLNSMPSVACSLVCTIGRWLAPGCTWPFRSFAGPTDLGWRKQPWGPCALDRT